MVVGVRRFVRVAIGITGQDWVRTVTARVVQVISVSPRLVPQIFLPDNQSRRTVNGAAA